MAIKLDGQVSADGRKIFNGKTQVVNLLAILESAARSGTHIIRSVTAPRGTIRKVATFKNKTGTNFRIYKLKRRSDAIVRLVEIGR